LDQAKKWKNKKEKKKILFVLVFLLFGIAPKKKVRQIPMYRLDLSGLFFCKLYGSSPVK